MKVAIIGGGIVGATAAYYLSKENDLDVTVFDSGHGQATKAAAGIISPWFSKRRNKAWYRMARLGADFYQTLVADLKADGFDTSFYQQSGIYLLKKKEKSLKDLLELAQERRQESPLIGDLELVALEEAKKTFPDLQGFDQAIFASGAARVEGAELTQTLLSAAACPVIEKVVKLELVDGAYLIDNQVFDKVILATGAWLPQMLSPLGYKVDVRPQKGQLTDYFFDDLETSDYPVLMPEGELDIIPFTAGKISVGASHENDKGYDLTLDDAILSGLEVEAQAFFPKISEANRKQHRVGTRAYTSDFSPFYGQVPDLSGVFAASGLGSSGLTTGPLIGHNLVGLLLGKETSLETSDYPIENYIEK
ncbi:NAD(P)/FAD-dependent oxidoreductase [Streptococcus loxodontisalivarius]|uniref:Glycine/D-amino acid oxidase-like deaminating enzyme n=1 Tax=Streptococcus loxodontisalivarius TaxID=1349415 RepID=A0ABS2PRZ7_9STRE|nr:FAD-dependent oxidoreductase [Streptococcus loxodontisalivarius]MBM7642651.1 glycine/D-amino acid oxidase-like deaminating enzyme [Streptococcus loxodontisalivarius]